MKKHLPEDIFNTIVLFMEHDCSRLIKREMKEIDDVIRPIYKIINIDYSNKSFFYKWSRLYKYKRNKQHLYHRFIADDMYHNF